MALDINKNEEFLDRHNGPDHGQIIEMLEKVNAETIEELIDKTIPRSIRLESELNLPEPKSEFQFLKDFKNLAIRNKIFKSYIGMGYYNCIVPSVILRNVLENPGWYTAYTPYQAEIAQGRLEALINFQTMVIDLTGMEIANASLLDEGTAAAEAMAMLAGLRKGEKKSANKFFVDINVFPQTIDILKTRAIPIGIDIEIGNLSDFNPNDPGFYGLYIQYPDNNGEVIDYRQIISKAKENRIFVAAGTDLMSLVLLTPPGEMGVDVVVGTSQRFGVPMGYGGPHAAFFATQEANKRQIPGRIIGVSIDAEGNKGYRMALQTREQHIRREKATSNICTAQVLLAVMAGFYAVYHGKDGLITIASRIHGLTKILDEGLQKIGVGQLNQNYFDTLRIELPDGTASEKVKEVAESREVNFRYFDDGKIGISLDETSSLSEVEGILSIFKDVLGKDMPSLDSHVDISWPDPLIRKSDFLSHPVFYNHHSEHDLLRYLKKLENKDLSLAHSMISLGSCTMKLNGTTEMIPVTWPEFGNIHPFAPIDQTEGYQQMFRELEVWLCEITGFAGISLQPNSGAQGEFAGLMVIKAFHESKGQGHRNVTLIPSSAHGTNPASAVMAGTKVVIVQCDEYGNIDIDDLKVKAGEHSENLAALMVTYPSTHGVFEEGIKEVCKIIHTNGGQVYMDGANMNAQVGLTSPAIIGADVCHLNLHKTFCIPHGGGGPGIGPIGVAAHLKQFLPGNPVVDTGGKKSITAISAAPWGSASILTISYAFIAMMGTNGLKKATEIAILNANYIMEKLKDYYNILYTGKHGRCAHEMILDCRDFKKYGVEVEDISKRLMDYGFHAPTVSFPVPGTLMVEPTESESKAELDRFCDALIQIRKEIEEIEIGFADKDDNVLKNSPHTMQVALSDEWQKPYSREKAVYPLAFVKENKFWPASSRIDSAYGDRHLFCSCIPLAEYSDQELSSQEA